MELRFYGAARGVTGSCHAIVSQGRTVLLDCGFFQGRRMDAWQRNSHFPFAPEEVDAVVLSHAHIDHSGRLPFLVHQGFEGEIHCTSGTRDLCELMLHDSAHILLKDAEYMNRKRVRARVRSRRARRRKERRKNRQEKGEHREPDIRRAELPEPEVEPLYLAEDVDEALSQFRPHEYGAWVDVLPGMRFRFHDAGHILGAASVEGEIDDGGRTWRVAFTGDYGRSGMPLLRSPEPLPEADIYLSESTYGDRLHPEFVDMESELADAVNRLARRGHGRLLIPAFAVGRTQNLLFALGQVFQEGRAPELPVVVDSPLATRVTEVVRRHHRYFNHEALSSLQWRDSGDPVFCPGVRFTASVDESKALNHDTRPLIIISASGMMESGRILHHLIHSVHRDDTEILVVGFQAEHTLGRRLVKGVERVNILGDSYPVRARITPMLGFSAHADRDDLLAALTPHAERAEALFLVHGEDKGRRALAEALGERGFRRIEEPVERQAFRF